MLRIPALLCLALALSAADPQLVFDLTLAEGSGDAPMIMAWVEKADGTFVRTVHIFSKDHKYYKDMLTWASAREGKTDNLDAVVGATISWGQHKVVKVPAGDLLGGGLVLRLEQRKDKGGHYKKRKIPLTADWPGVTLEKEGYFAKLVITVER
jgi:hypothetical protein